MRKTKIINSLIIIGLIVVSLLLVRVVWAQDFGVEQLGDELGGVIGETGKDPRTTIANIINLALGFLAIIALGIVLYAGTLWMTSAGNEDKITKAKNTLKAGLIGLGIILSAWIIVTFAIGRLGGTGGEGSGSWGSDGSGGKIVICSEGETASCGCGGITTCHNNRWGACLGESSECENPPTDCSQGEQFCAEGYYCDDNNTCQPKSSFGESCNLSETEGVCQVADNQCGAYLTCNPSSCVCLGPPVITGLSPLGGFCQSDVNTPCLSDADCSAGDSCDLSTPNGAPNDFITIFGHNFGNYVAGTSQVTFTAHSGEVIALSPGEINSACVDVWRNDQIIIAVPSQAISGPIKVVNSAGEFDYTDDELGPVIPDFLPNNIGRPGLCYIDPAAGTLNNEVAYQGINLYGGQAYFGNYRSNVKGLHSNFNEESGLSGSASVPNIQTGTSGSFVEQTVNNNSLRSNFLRFVKVKEESAGAKIISLSPQSGTSGQYVTIRGTGFGNARGQSRVYFSNETEELEANYTFPAICANSVWTDKQLIVKVPEEIADGDYRIKIKLANNVVIDSREATPNSFLVNSSLELAPSVCKMEPSKGPVGTLVTFWGEYFGTRDVSVIFNSDKKTSGQIKTANQVDETKVAVPLGAITGPVSLLSKNKVSNELPFTVGECSSDSECSGQVCCPASTYKKGRCVNDLEECFIEVPNSVFEWRFSTYLSPRDPELDKYCAEFNESKEICGRESGCCFRADEDKCIGGQAVKSGSNRYLCETEVNNSCLPSDNPLSCASQAGCCLGVENECVEGNPIPSGSAEGYCESDCFEDDECAGGEQVVCGLDQKCVSRPEVIAVLPNISETEVCRNTAVKISFNQKMNVLSLLWDNLLLLEEKDSGTCPEGTYLASAEGFRLAKSERMIARVWTKAKNSLRAWFGLETQVMAAPDNNKVYCSVKGSTGFFEGEKGTELLFFPDKLLTAGAKHYVVVKGDAAEDNNQGVLSLAGAGMVADGYRNASGDTINPATFNAVDYTNSYSYEFTTNPDQKYCEVDKVLVSPRSYLFQRTDQDVKENDDDYHHPSFDSVSDGDKLFIALALDKQNRVLAPSPEYDWTWSWSAPNNVVTLRQDIANLPQNNILVTASPKASNEEARVTATIITTGESLAGTKTKNYSDIFIFPCANPWPAPKSNGEWSPWVDGGACLDGNCDSFNYRFYYCRDAGGPGTYDDLPVISENPVSLSGSLVWSLDASPCSQLGAVSSQGICSWGVLKESYFFRESILSGIEITNLVDTKQGGQVEVSWQSTSNQVKAFKIYYLGSGQREMQTKELSIAGANCQRDSSGTNYLCHTTINGLVNNIPYIFKMNLISEAGTESQFSQERLITATDKTPPSAPTGFKVEVTENTLLVSWDSGSEPELKYRLYFGARSGVYGGSFDVNQNSLSLNLPDSRLPQKATYFAVSAIDKHGNESDKTVEVYLNLEGKN